MIDIVIIYSINSFWKCHNTPLGKENIISILRMCKQYSENNETHNYYYSRANNEFARIYKP